MGILEKYLWFFFNKKIEKYDITFLKNNEKYGLYGHCMDFVSFLDTRNNILNVWVTLYILESFSGYPQ